MQVLTIISEDPAWHTIPEKHRRPTLVVCEESVIATWKDELETHFEKWLYVMQNLKNLTDRPAKLQERIFNKLFDQAEIANFDEQEYIEYEESLKAYRDLKNSIDAITEDVTGIAMELKEIKLKVMRLHG